MSLKSPLSLVQSRWCLPSLLSAGLLGSILTGCGGNSQPQAPAAGTASQAAAPAEQPAPRSVSAEVDAPKTAGGKKEIPLDVWYDDPVAISNQKGSAPQIASAAPPAEMPAEEPKESSPPEETAPAGGGDWDSVITSEEIQNEIKKIRIQLADNLSAVTKYNAHYKEIQHIGAQLAALASIAPQLKDKLSWVADAPHLRDLGTEMADTAKNLGQKDYDATKKIFDRIDQLLGGNKPADLPEAIPDLPLSEVASRSKLMYIIEQKSEFLKANFQTEDALKKGQDDAIQAAAILATMSKVINTEGYDFADEEEYQNYCKQMQELSQAMGTAAKNGDQAAFSDAAGRIIKLCTECHSGYRNS